MSQKLKEKIKNDMKESLRNKESEKLSVLKMLLSSIANEEIKLNKKEEGLEDEQTLKIIKSEAKKRKDSIEAFVKAGRDDLKEKEERELSMLEDYLPEEMPTEKIEEIVKEIVDQESGGSMQNFGKIMKEAMSKIGDQADGKRVSEIVRKLLND